MIGAFLLFSLIVILPYFLYFKKQYKESNNKKIYLRENLYQSTLWIALLVAMPILIVNLFFKDAPPPLLAQVDPDVSLEKLKDTRMDSVASVDFHFKYLNKFCEKGQQKDSHEDLKGYYKENVYAIYKDISNWGLGYYFYKQKSIDSALYYLNKVDSTNLKYHNYVLGCINITQENQPLAWKYLVEEAKLPNGATSLALPGLATIVQETEDIDLLSEMLQIPGAGAYLNDQVVRKIQLLNVDLLGYSHTILRWFTRDINFTGFLAALLILIVWISYLIKIAFFEKTGWGLISSALVLGMMFSFMTLLLSDTLHFVFNMWGDIHQSVWSLFIYSVFGIGAIEELVKIIPLLIILVVVGRSLQPFEYILLASISALGFAFIENLIYFHEDGYGSIIHARALTSAVGHMVDSSIFAYGLVLVRYKQTRLHPIGAFFLFWFLASLAHGLYDFWLFAQLVLFFVFFLFLIIRIWNTINNNCINNSKNFVYSKRFKTKPIQFYLAIVLTAILMFEYMVVAILNGPSAANDSIIKAAFSGSFLIMFLGSKLSSLNLIKNYWARINFSVNPFTDDVVSQNFIGQKVYLTSYYSDGGLMDFFPNGVWAMIAKRIVLLKRKPTFFMANTDSEWFMVKLAKPLKARGFMEDRALIKFKEVYSSLNAKKRFMVNLLLIPKDLPEPKMMRSNFESLGWVFLRTPESY